MESGSAGSLPLFDAYRRDLLWDAFAANVSACAGVLRGSTFPCLRNASTSDLLTSWEAAIAVFPDLFLFVPVLDGADGLIPDLPFNILAMGHVPTIPFIAGTVLDEGTTFVPQELYSITDLFNFFLDADSPYPPRDHQRARRGHRRAARAVLWGPGPPQLAIRDGEHDVRGGRAVQAHGGDVWGHHVPGAAAGVDTGGSEGGRAGIQLPLHRPKRGWGGSFSGRYVQWACTRLGLQWGLTPFALHSPPWLRGSVRVRVSGHRDG